MKKRLMSIFMSIVMVIAILPSYSFESMAETTGEVYGDFLYVDYGDGTAAITGYTGTDTIVEVPSTIFGSSVIAIEYTAFLDCTTIEDFVFPDTVQYIMAFAFQGCTSLKEITLPENLLYIGADIFLGCTSLENIYISEDNPYFSTENGILYNKTKTNIHRFPIASAIKNYTMPETVTSVDKRAFFRCESLETVVASNNLTKINEDAFYACPLLKSITLGNALQTIEAYAFEGCTALESIVIPDTVTTIKQRAFCDCESLKNVVIGNGMKTIGASAFESCEKLETVTFGNSVTELGNYAFYYCLSLESVTLPDTLTKIGIYAFASCETLKNIEIPSGVTAIPNYLFAYCSALKTVTLPVTITSIGYGAFSNTTSLTDIYFGGSKAQWDAITISSTNNQYLQSATIHYVETEHTMSEWQITVEAELGKEGEQRRVCSVCGYTETRGYLLGDTSGDSIIDENDYAMIIQASACGIELEEEQAVASDINKDGAVDTFDAMAVDMYIN